MTNPFANPAAVAPANPFAAVATPVVPVAEPTAPAPGNAHNNTPPPAPAGNPFAATNNGAAAGGGDQFDDPATQVIAPRLRDGMGRLVIIVPWRLDRNVKTDFVDQAGNPVMQDRMTADVVFCDGGPIHYGGNPEEDGGKAHDMVADTPLHCERRYISNKGIVSQCRKALGANLADPGSPPRMVIGRLAFGERKGKNKPPIILTPATPAERAAAAQWLAMNPITADPFA